LISALRQRQPGAPLWRIALWDTIHFICYLSLVLLYRHRAYGVSNIPRTGAVLYVCNHQSFLDPPIVGAASHRRQFLALARSTLFDSRIGGYILRKLDTIPVIQGTSDLRAMRRCIAELKKGHALLIFPEGARTLSGKVEPFETGTMLIIKRAKPLVVPVAVDGAFDAWKRGGRPKVRGRVGVIFGKPIPADQIVDMGPDHGLTFLRDQVQQLRSELAQRLTGA